MQNNTYLLSTGEADRQRLAILNRIYNPIWQEFLVQHGLKHGMQVLEIGCGTGIMAMNVAKQIGPTGKVIATDYSVEQLKIAEDNAKKAGINNIEFRQVDVRNLENITEKFDLTYGRWVLEFVQDSEESLKNLYRVLKPGGTLTYVGSSFQDGGYFTYPHAPVVDKWFQLAIKGMESFNLGINFGNSLYSLFNKIGCKEIVIQLQQPVLTTTEDKSLLRLGALSAHDNWMQNKVITEANFHSLIEELSTFEQSDAIIGFFRTILIKGIKQ